MSYRRTAMKVSEDKRERPWLYCSECLWLTGGGNCPRHGGLKWTPERQKEATRLAREEREREQ